MNQRMRIDVGLNVWVVALVVGLGLGLSAGCAPAKGTAYGTPVIHVPVPVGSVAAGQLSVARMRHLAVADHDGAVWFLGGDTAGGPTATIEVYDSFGGVHVSSSPLLTARSSAAGVLLPDGRIWVAGGTGASGRPLASTEFLDTWTGRVMAGPSLNTARSGATASLCWDGDRALVLVAGGQGTAGPLATTEILDVQLNSLSTGPAMSTTRRHGAALRAGAGLVVVAGGENAWGPAPGCDLFDARTRSFRRMNLAEARAEAVAALLPGGYLALAGGRNTLEALSDAEFLHPVAGTALKLPAGANPARYAAAGTVLADGSLFIAGGNDGTGPVASAERIAALGSVVRTPVAGLASARQNARATALADGSVLVSGGVDGQGNITATLERFDLGVSASPEILAASPSSATAGSVVELSGMGFSAVRADVQVALDGVPCEVLAASATALSVKLPAGTLGSSVQVHIAGRAAALFGLQVTAAAAPAQTAVPAQTAAPAQTTAPVATTPVTALPVVLAPAAPAPVTPMPATSAPAPVAAPAAVPAPAVTPQIAFTQIPATVQSGQGFAIEWGVNVPVQATWLIYGIDATQMAQATAYQNGPAGIFYEPFGVQVPAGTTVYVMAAALTANNQGLQSRVEQIRVVDASGAFPQPAAPTHAQAQTQTQAQPQTSSQTAAPASGQASSGTAVTLNQVVQQIGQQVVTQVAQTAVQQVYTQLPTFWQGVVQSVLPALNIPGLSNVSLPAPGTTTSSNATQATPVTTAATPTQPQVQVPSTVQGTSFEVVWGLNNVQRVDWTRVRWGYDATCPYGSSSQSGTAGVYRQTVLSGQAQVDVFVLVEGVADGLPFQSQPVKVQLR